MPIPGLKLKGLIIFVYQNSFFFQIINQTLHQRHTQKLGIQTRKLTFRTLRSIHSLRSPRTSNLSRKYKPRKPRKYSNLFLHRASTDSTGHTGRYVTSQQTFSKEWLIRMEIQQKKMKTPRQNAKTARTVLMQFL